MADLAITSLKESTVVSPATKRLARPQFGCTELRTPGVIVTLAGGGESFFTYEQCSCTADNGQGVGIATTSAAANSVLSPVYQADMVVTGDALTLGDIFVNSETAGAIKPVADLDDEDFVCHVGVALDTSTMLFRVGRADAIQFDEQSIAPTGALSGNVTPTTYPGDPIVAAENLTAGELVYYDKIGGGPYPASLLGSDTVITSQVPEIGVVAATVVKDERGIVYREGNKLSFAGKTIYNGYYYIAGGTDGTIVPYGDFASEMKLRIVGIGCESKLLLLSDAQHGTLSHEIEKA